MKFLVGKKLEMTQTFNTKGEVIPVTKILAGPCFVTQLKNPQKHGGYAGVQIGFGRKKNISKPLRGHLKELDSFAFLKEYRLQDERQLENMQRGKRIGCEIFKQGEMVSVSGVSKGRGFQGVVKRWGFSGSPASHGHKDQLRMPGSIGSTGPGHVFKGKKMPGRMGGDHVTVKNLEVVDVDKDHNWLFVKGAIPGKSGGVVWIKGDD